MLFGAVSASNLDRQTMCPFPADALAINPHVNRLPNHATRKRSYHRQRVSLAILGKLNVAILRLIGRLRL